MLWQRFLYDNLNLPYSWIFRPRITRITLNLSQFFRVNSRVSWAALPNKKQNSTPHLALRWNQAFGAIPSSTKGWRKPVGLMISDQKLPVEKFLEARIFSRYGG
jgi:hypothetical protein